MPPEPLDSQAVPQQERRNRLALRVLLAFVGMYCLGVGVMAVAKIAVNPRSLQWDEVYQGPAYTLGCCLVLFAVGVRVRNRWRRRREA